MNRRRSVPWLHRWSRVLIGSIAIIGALLTAYLTIVKLTGGDAACTAEAAQAGGGCNDVLNSAYATVFGLPLSLFGCLAYIGMATCALGPLALNSQTNKSLKNQIENWTWLLLLAGSTAMAVFSGYLMYILATELKTLCPYCIGSAIFSLSLLFLSIFGHDWDDFGQLITTGLVVAMITIVGTLGVYANVNPPEIAAGGPVLIPGPQGAPIPPKGWTVTTTSGAAEIALAKHLTSMGAKEYGAFWCPHCYEQKQLFGKEAFSKINYVECDSQGVNPKPEACSAAGIKSFPTWEIKGQLLPGTQKLEKLAEVSKYQGPNQFKYKLPY